jgi:hypothetical protein
LLAVVVVWAVTGPLFGFSDTWQPVINNGTTIVTFLMVLLIQATQNRDKLALYLKLDDHLVENRRQGSIPIGRSWKLEWQAAHFCSQHRSRICWYFRWHRQSVEDREALNEARAPALLFDPSAFSVCHCSWEA